MVHIWLALYMQVVLERNKVDFNPRLKKLAALVSGSMEELTSTLANIHRLPDLLTKRPSGKDPIYR